MFRVTTLPLDDASSIPLSHGKKNIDFKEDFFGKAAFLTVSGQLSGEAYGEL
jgi:asparaginyl-tRNA synthetase